MLLNIGTEMVGVFYGAVYLDVFKIAKIASVINYYITWWYNSMSKKFCSIMSHSRIIFRHVLKSNDSGKMVVDSIYQFK